MASPSLLLLLLLLLAGGAAARPCKTLFISYTFSSSSSSSSGRYFAVHRIFRPAIVDLRQAEMMMTLPAEPSSGMSSLHERAKDILVVVAGLLFGVACGALTGAIMYLAWSLFTNRYEICRFGDDEEEEEEEMPRKMGYAKIAEPMHAKEGYEGR